MLGPPRRGRIRSARHFIEIAGNHVRIALRLTRRTTHVERLHFDPGLKVAKNGGSHSWDKQGKANRIREKPRRQQKCA
jgi:hypothetical protein